MTIDPNELRRRFLTFFDERMKAHARANGSEVRGSLILPSSSLQPPDASTLFTSAGMHQFKDDFTGNLIHGTRAAATVQKCMRTPDLENVGKTARHHTFFEMLGFFSFGDGLKGPNGSVGFFKNEAIRWIWDFYTLPESEGGCALDKSRIYVSVYGGDETGAGRDDEAANIWREILGKVWPAEEVERRIFFLGEHDNFWPAGAPSLGPNGVCGPCSEIFYDCGPEYGEGDVATNGARFMEIGNIVFTQYERSGPTPGKGTLTLLPAMNIDFGGGFERLVMVKEGVKTTLDSSLFHSIRLELRELAGKESSRFLPDGYSFGAGSAIGKGKSGLSPGVTPYMAGCEILWQALTSGPATPERVHAWRHGRDQRSFFEAGVWRRLIDGSQLWRDSFERDVDLVRAAGDSEVREKRIADHIRAITFAMADGILPSNEGAGYVIRRMIRRAFRDGAALGFGGPFLNKLVPVVVAQNGAAYPGLGRNDKAIAATIQQEEQQFSTTLDRGLQQLSVLIRDLKAKGERTLAGKPAFDLYQSQGLPREVVQDELAAEGLHLDLVGYEEAEQQHRERSKGAKFAVRVVFDVKTVARITAPTEFVGYESCTSTSQIQGIERDGHLPGELHAGNEAAVVLDRSPFYAESGGQVGDTGVLEHDGARFLVEDCQKRGNTYLHFGRLLSGKLRTGEFVTARVDEPRRNKIRFNHSATHLMHAALRKVLGEHVVQRGSEVGPDRLRFDFSHPKAVTFEERQQIERLVNEQVQANAQVGTAIMSPEDAQQAGAMALFGEKYGDKVRVLTMGTDGFSKELCGGTHVARTGDIGYFRITSEGSSASGIRRIEAVTGLAAYELAAEEARMLAQLHALTKSQPGKVLEKVEGLLKEVKDLKSRSRKEGAGPKVDDLRKNAERVGDASLYVADLGDATVDDLLTTKQALGQDAGPFAILLGARAEGRAMLLLAFSKDLVSRGLHAGKIVGEMARFVDGKGGGKPDVAQAGGRNPEGLPQALQQGRELLRGKLAT